MKIFKILDEALLLHESLNGLKKKFHDQIPDDIIEYFYKQDPSGNKEHYAKFMCLMYLSADGEASKEEVFTYVDKYVEIGKVKDQYKLKLKNLSTYSDFSKFQDDIKALEQEIDNIDKRQTSSAEYDIVDENNKWVAISPKTFEASEKYGTDADWCTTKTKAYFRNYSNEQRKLVIFTNKELYNKYKQDKVPKNRRNPMYKVQANIRRVGVAINGQSIPIVIEFKNLFNSTPDIGFEEFLDSTGLDESKLVDSSINHEVDVDMTPEDQKNLAKIASKIPDFEIKDGAIVGKNINISGLGLTTLGPLPFGYQVSDSEVSTG